MVETITATYEHDNDDWTITVSGRGKELTAKAPGIIAARDRVDQLVEKLASNEHPTVVHLLNGNALEFTSAYMTARLTLPEQAPLEVPPSGGKKDPAPATDPVGSGASGTSATDEDSAAPEVPAPASAEPSPEATAGKPALPPSKQLAKEVQDRAPGEVPVPGRATGAPTASQVARA
ncbi:hypothetical protein ATK36_4953 [Amycolatopsis sulphurea]|uniref:Uncharacterized protein n=1 Tax=Amycolatopsis sulphurea TaxID=76022 RepID=A0A2A9FH62_9PSEU|nr:hypothetical protein [Amycolatopsis sulphurea]PFG49775.1 hypothetical protein ATK36_4953 [Amycolatopsis sulphurea]